MKIIVAHPGRQHSYRLASALKKNEMLAYYCTTIYDKESSGLMKFVKRFLSKDNLKRANGRRNPDLEDNDVIQYCEFGGMVEAFLARVDKTHKIYTAVQQYNANRFGKKVAKLAIKNKVDAVICYDTNSLACFKYLSKNAPHIIRIQDVSHSARPFEKKLFEEEIERSGNLDFKSEDVMLWNKRFLNKAREEIAVTQYFLVPSQFVKKGLVFCGVESDNIFVVPYGANVESDIVREQKGTDDTVNFLFVGLVNYRKGIPYLLKAFSQLEAASATLTLTGTYDKNSWFVQEYLDKENIRFTGRVLPQEVKKIYESSDVFVIDSFAEGMAQVGIEAMACGLPIICSENSGVNDLVTDGENGFVIPCGDADILAEKMQWFIDNKEKIADMGANARIIAKQYTWQRYGDDISKTLQKIC